MRIDPLIAADIPLAFDFPDAAPDPGRTALIALGKSALFMVTRFFLRHPSFRAVPGMAIVPEGLPRDDADLPSGLTVIASTHPHITGKSFAAGEALVEFVSAQAADRDTFIVLLSGGASALIEYGSDPAEFMRLNRELLRAGLPIQEMNRRRIALSGIKGGKLPRFAPQADWTTFVMSDIPAPDGHRLVGSMPSWSPDEPRHHLVPVANGGLLHDRYAAELRRNNYRIAAEERFLTGTVGDWTRHIAAQELGPGEALLITGEPTLALTIATPGIGGRMAHLALLLAERLDEGLTLHALSSDGIDGASPYAGVIFTPEDRSRFDRTLIADHLARFDAYSFFEKYGCALKTGYTGVNLNDVVIVTRD
ncbi:MAG TPA: DUF4147 domain-containing protein [bacterium]|nr:DUF4147 domain-containing protein [bacterium]